MPGRAGAGEPEAAFGVADAQARNRRSGRRRGAPHSRT